MENSKQEKKYLRSIKRLLPATSNTKKKIIGMVKNALSARCSESPEKDISEIIKDFGSPEDVAASYIEDMGTSEILKGFRKRKTIINIIIAGIAGVLVFTALALTIALIDVHNAAEDFKNGHFEIATVTIEEQQTD